MTTFSAKFLNFMIAFVNVILLLFNTSTVKKTAPQINVDELTLTFSDEFDGDSLDTTKWRAHDGGGVRKGGYWSLDQARVEDGNLIITTQYIEDGEKGPDWYTCGLDTAKSHLQTYGYFECRCILPKGQGLWSAFWMTNSNVWKESDDATQGAELDIMESPFWHLGGKAAWKITQIGRAHV